MSGRPAAAMPTSGRPTSGSSASGRPTSGLSASGLSASGRSAEAGGPGATAPAGCGCAPPFSRSPPGSPPNQLSACGTGRSGPVVRSERCAGRSAPGPRSAAGRGRCSPGSPSLLAGGAGPATGSWSAADGGWSAARAREAGGSVRVPGSGSRAAGRASRGVDLVVCSGIPAEPGEFSSEGPSPGRGPSATTVDAGSRPSLSSGTARAAASCTGSRSARGSPRLPGSGPRPTAPSDAGSRPAGGSTRLPASGPDPIRTSAPGGGSASPTGPRAGACTGSPSVFAGPLREWGDGCALASARSARWPGDGWSSAGTGDRSGPGDRSSSGGAGGAVSDPGRWDAPAPEGGSESGGSTGSGRSGSRRPGPGVGSVVRSTQAPSCGPPDGRRAQPIGAGALLRQALSTTWEGPIPPAAAEGYAGPVPIAAEPASKESLWPPRPTPSPHTSPS
jgi:hypothetical protein